MRTPSGLAQAQAALDVIDARRRAAARQVAARWTGLDARLRFAFHPAAMHRYELVPRRRPDGTVVLEAVPTSPVQRLRAAIRRLLGR